MKGLKWTDMESDYNEYVAISQTDSSIPLLEEGLGLQDYKNES